MTDKLLAALMFFTRLPVGCKKKMDAECFRHVVDYWPLVGWLTGGTVALAYWLSSPFSSPAAAAWIALGARLLLTGALHEDGLADFCDGFGGGRTRERTLAIMKDSRIGTYGVLGLVFCIGLQVSLIAALPSLSAPAVVFTADVYAKACGSFIVLQLPYARTAEQSKSGVTYSAWTGRAAGRHVFRCLLAIAPGAAWFASMRTWVLFPAFLIPPATEILLVRWMRHRLQGYTGDCCGALFLCCELSFLLPAVVLCNLA